MPVGVLEGVDDQGPDLLGLAVVRVVVPGRQGVGPEHDPTLHLGAEAGRPGGAYHGLDVVPVHSQAVADPVVARQVRRGFGRRQQVIGGQPVGQFGDRALRHRGPGGRQRLRRPPHLGRHLGGDAVDELLGQPHPEPVHPRLEVLDGPGGGPVERRRVERVVTGDHLEQSSAASATVALNGPIWSSELANATNP